MNSGTKTILIVDDEEMVIDVANAMLTHLGYQVITASNGSMALEKFEQYGDTIDIVILDLSMPDLDGFECLDRIREKSQVPVLLSSGMSHSISEEEAFERKAQGILPKPFSLDNLKQLLESAIIS